MAKRRRIRWDRVFLVFGPLLLFILILGVSCRHRSGSESSSADSSNPDIIVDSSEPAVSDVIPADKPAKTITICIDAGHGGNDSGATDKSAEEDPENKEHKRLEKDDNLNLALAVRDSFRKNYPDVQIIMTRETDVYVDLQERCDIANNANADFFISLHRNSSTSGNGVEVWINNDSMGDNTWDKLMAEYILDWLDQVGISERRGIHYGYREGSGNYESNNYHVNRYTNMPSCLVEMGFMSSKIDNRNFDDHLNEYADAISGAMMELLSDKGLYPAKT